MDRTGRPGSRRAGRGRVARDGSHGTHAWARVHGLAAGQARTVDIESAQCRPDIHNVSATPRAPPPPVAPNAADVPILQNSARTPARIRSPRPRRRSRPLRRTVPRRHPSAPRHLLRGRSRRGSSASRATPSPWRGRRMANRTPSSRSTSGSSATIVRRSAAATRNICHAPGAPRRRVTRARTPPGTARSATGKSTDPALASS